MDLKIRNILPLLIVLTPLLEPYRLGGVSLDTLMLFVTIVLTFFARKDNTKISYNFRPFLLYAFTIPNVIALASGYYSHISSSIIVLLLYVLATVKVFPNLQLDLLAKYYKRIVIASCIVFIFQELMYASVGFRYSFLIPYLDIRYEGLTMSSFIYKQMYEPRSSAFFLEPSHLAQYLLPCLAIILGENTNGLSVKKYLFPFILTVILFYLRSGCGLIGASCIWIVYLLLIDLSRIKKVLFIGSSIVIALIAWRYLENTEIVQGLLLRSTELSADADYERSGVIRVTRGFLVYNALDLSQKIFGVGTGGSINAIENSPIFYMFLPGDRYLNNFQTLLIGFGVVGTYLFLRYLFTLYNKNHLSGKLILSAFLGLCLVESFFLTSKMILYFSFVYLFKEKIKENE